MTRRLSAIEEQLTLDRRVVETGRVRIGKVGTKHTEQVDVPLDITQVDITTVPVGRHVDAPAPVRQEGDVLIIPVHEEVAVVTRQLVLVEELHVRRRVTTTVETHEVTLRREEITVERTRADSEPAGPPEHPTGPDPSPT